jgi:TatD DNase family protein
LYASIGIHPHEAGAALQKGHLDAFAQLLHQEPQLSHSSGVQGAGEQRTEPYQGTVKEQPQLATPQSAESAGRLTGSASEQVSAVRKIVAVGETGLDFFYNHSPKDAQIEVLRFQIELALDHNLPLVFHVREAFDDFWPIFDSYGGKIRGVLHSFTDSQANLDKAIERGLSIGVNGIATFAKHEKQLDMYRAIPLKNLLLETDAPFLTPIPYRGNICEPYHVETTANFLHNLRGENLEELAEATTHNAEQLFGIK